MESVEVNAKLDYAVFAWESVQYSLFDLYIIDYFIDYLFLICLPLSYLVKFVRRGLCTSMLNLRLGH